MSNSNSERRVLIEGLSEEIDRIKVELFDIRQAVETAKRSSDRQFLRRAHLSHRLTWCQEIIRGLKGDIGV
jgi:hypothetical protein